MNGTELITELLGNLSNAFSKVDVITGALVSAIFLRKNTRTEEFEKIKAKKFEEVTEQLLDSGQMTYTEFYKAKNFLKIAQKADKQYRNLNIVDTKNITYNFDWFIRFYEAAGNISNAEVQKLWAKLLADEIQNPESHSLRTIDVLKNISKQEVFIFTEICKNVVVTKNSIFLPNYDKYLQSRNISYDMIMQISEIGLIYNDASLVIQVPIVENKEWNLITEKSVVSGNIQNCDKYYKIQQYPLTTTGRELFNLLDFSEDIGNVVEMARILKEKKNDVLSVYQIVSRIGGKIEYEERNMLE